MLARVVYGLAALAFLVALLGHRASTRDVVHYPGQLEGGLPIVVYEPGEPRSPFAEPEFETRLPVVVLGHGFTGNAAMMSSIARSLARAGYAVVVIEFRGHGHNPAPLGGRVTDGRGGLYQDLHDAVLFARTRPHFDPQRIAVMGHSMGAFASLDYASWEPNVAATVLISGGGGPVRGPHTPPNTLFLWASGDPQGLREGAKARAAEIAGLERVVLEKTYGNVERGSGVLASEVPGVDHLTILYSSVAWQRIAAWLDQTMGPGVQPRGDPLSDGRYGWTLLGAIAFGVLLWGAVGLLAPLVPFVPLADPAPIAGLGILVGAGVLAMFALAAADPSAIGGPLGFLVPLTVSRDVATFLFVTGLLIVGVLALQGRIGLQGLSVGTAGSALALFGLCYLALGSLLTTYNGLWLAPHRAQYLPLVALLLLPFYAGFEHLLRSARSTRVWLPILGRVSVLAVLVVGAVTQLLPGFLILAVGGFTLSFTLFEIVAFRAARVAPNPWMLAIFQALMSAWTQTALFPTEL